MIFSQKMYLCISDKHRSMMLKKHIALFFLALCAAPTVRAQLTFDTAQWDFGQIAEAGGCVSHVFTGVNRSPRPVVILDVVASCGCTRPEFSRKPILPGDSTRITVTYDPMNRPGAFDRELGVYSTERKRIATLSVRGSVTPRERSVEELYPVDAGGGLRIDETLCAFTYIYPGKRVQSAIGFANTSERTLHLELRPTAASGLLTVSHPETVAPGQRGAITLSYLIPAGSARYGTLRDALELCVDGRSNGTAVVAHALGVDDPASTPADRAPQAQVSDPIIKLGAVKRTGPVQRRTFTLSNTGRSDLIVRAVENDGRVAVTLAPGRRIAPHGSCRVELLLDPSQLDYGPFIEHLLLFTNDPHRPMRKMRITAVIED